MSKPSVQKQANFGLLVREDVGDNGEPEEGFDDGVLFYVNKRGLPIDGPTWERMWSHVSRIHPDGHQVALDIRGNTDLPEVAIPRAPLNFPPNTSAAERLEVIQKYMSELQYNHTGTQFYEIRKNRPISGLMDTAKEMIQEALPIKCLEAVILGIYLTNGMSATDRFPISFKTVFSGNVHRHVVLGVYSGGKYGALGMSRRSDLMFKSLRHKHLSELVSSFLSAYKQYCHDVKKVKIGVPVPHDAHSYEQIQWKALSLTVKKLSREDHSRELDHHAREMRMQTSRHEALTSVYVPAKSKPSSAAVESPQMYRRSTPGGGLGNISSTQPDARPRKVSKKSVLKPDGDERETNCRGASSSSGNGNPSGEKGVASSPTKDKESESPVLEPNSKNSYQIRI